MGSSKVSVEVGDQVALVTINNPPVNSLSNSVFNGLYKVFKGLEVHDEIKAIIITGANGKFCGGADIRGFQKSQNKEEQTETTIVSPLSIINRTIEACEKPVVAAMEGFALGGGLELAMACHARIAAKGTRLGLPELELGIIPGLGGTQRLPRLVGLEKALDMLLNSRSIAAEEAREIGLVDVVLDSSDFISRAKTQALGMEGFKLYRNVSLYRIDKIGNIEESLNILEKARVFSKRKYRNVTYPFVCLDVVEEGLRKGGEAGTELENRTSHALVKTFEARALMHIFFARRSSFKVVDVTNLDLRERSIKRAGIVGCGLMGSGIATALVAHNIPVLLKDISLANLQSGMKTIRENLESLVKRGKMNSRQAQESLELVRTTEEYTGFGDLDLVVESVYEDVSLKQRIFHELEGVCSVKCILASNTSSIDIHTIGAKVSCPDRVVGLHFFCPAHVMQLLEIVRIDQTSRKTVVDLLALTRTLHKVPVVARSVPGFAVNRLFVSYLMISTFLVDLGMDPYHIDSVMKEFGMPMGPFRVADFTGINIFHRSSPNLFQANPESFHRSPVIPLLLKDNRQGKSTKSGFYDYKFVDEGAKTSDLKKYVERSRQMAQVKGAHTNIQNITNPEIVEMIFLRVANEACKVMEEKVVTGPESLDLASVLGMGFPSYRGGIIFWADSLGPVYIRDKLQQWRHQYGNVYKPCALLEGCAASNKPLGKVLINASNL